MAFILILFNEQLLTNFGALYAILEQLVADGFSHAG